MRLFTGAFICGLVFIANVYAETAVVEQQAQPEEQGAVAASPPPAFVVEPASTTSMPVNTTMPQAVSSQPVSPPAEVVVQPMSTMPQEQYSAVPQNVGVVTPISGSGAMLNAQELTGRVVTLETRVAQLSERINLIESENKLGAQGKADIVSQIQQKLNSLKSYLGPQLYVVLMSAIILFLLFLLINIIIPRRKKTGVTKYPQEILANFEKEHHLMEGESDIAAKLNLSHAYIEMGQESKAEAMLHEVLSHGNPSEQAEAKGLLEKIKQKSGG